MAPRDDKSSSSSANGATGAAFAQHAAADAALQPPPSNNDDDSAAQQQQQRGLTLLGRLTLFIVFPSGVGLLGLYSAYLESRRKPERGPIQLDRDFVLPFLLALAFVIVIGLQTSGYKSREAQPLIAWPKVKRVKKFVKRSRKKGDNNDNKPIKED